VTSGIDVPDSSMPLAQSATSAGRTAVQPGFRESLQQIVAQLDQLEQAAQSPSRGSAKARLQPAHMHARRFQDAVLRAASNSPAAVADAGVEKSRASNRPLSTPAASAARTSDPGTPQSSTADSQVAVVIWPSPFDAGFPPPHSDLDSQPQGPSSISGTEDSNMRRDTLSFSALATLSPSGTFDGTPEGLSGRAFDAASAPSVLRTGHEAADSSPRPQSPNDAPAPAEKSQAPASARHASARQDSAGHDMPQYAVSPVPRTIALATAGQEPEGIAAPSAIHTWPGLPSFASSRARAGTAADAAPTASAEPAAPAVYLHAPSNAQASKPADPTALSPRPSHREGVPQDASMSDAKGANAAGAPRTPKSGQPLHLSAEGSRVTLNLQGLPASHPAAAQIIMQTSVQDSSAAAATRTDTAAQRAASDTFSALDIAGSMPASTWLHAGVRHAEAGYLDPSLGWVGVRAEAA
jgi:hypothetical protein